MDNNLGPMLAGIFSELVDSATGGNNFVLNGGDPGLLTSLVLLTVADASLGLHARTEGRLQVPMKPSSRNAIARSRFGGQPVDDPPLAHCTIPMRCTDGAWPAPESETV